MAAFGEQLRKLRESKSLSIKDYADLVPLSVSYLSEIERGLKPSPGMSMIERIAEVLDVKPDYFDEYKAEKVRNAVLGDPRLDLLFRLIIRLPRREREEVLSFVRGLGERTREDLPDIFDPRVDRLLENIEKSFRVGTLDEVRFADFRDTLSMAVTPANHLIRGRQGTGKTSLILKAHQENLHRGNISFYLDAEVYKNLSFPESLIRLMEEIFSSLGDIIRDNLERSEGGLLGQITGSSKRKRDLENLRKIGDAVNGKVLFLEDLLRQYVHLELSGESAGKREDLRESKKERLEKEAINLGILLEGISKVGGLRSIFVYVDDFQFLPTVDQTEILDFLRRISKGKRIFLKVAIGSRDKTKGQDDFEIINLDHPLVDLKEMCKFFEALLSLHGEDNIVRPGNIQLILKGESIMSALALSSGGVIRDFLKIFRKSVRAARTRQGKSKREACRVDIEDVKTASLEYLVENKYMSLRDLRDDSAHSIQGNLLNQLKRFCSENSTSLFSAKNNSDKNSLKEMVDARLLHLVSSSPGKGDPVYMLDAGLCIEEGIPVKLEADDPFSGQEELPVFRL